jgi:hypothetical protein
MVEAFHFEDEGRSYSCFAEARRASPSEPWWWFDVSGDRQRYAPFRAESDDTVASVQSRIVAFHGSLLARRAAHVPYRPFRTR